MLKEKTTQTSILNKIILWKLREFMTFSDKNKEFNGNRLVKTRNDIGNTLG